MFVVRESQMAAFRRAAEARLLEAVTEHARRHFPDECAAIAPVDLERTLEHALLLARAVGLRSERALFKYVGLFLFSGEELGSTANTAWMLEYLRDPAVEDPDERIARLEAEALRRAESRLV